MTTNFCPFSLLALFGDGDTQPYGTLNNVATLYISLTPTETKVYLARAVHDSYNASEVAENDGSAYSKCTVEIICGIFADGRPQLLPWLLLYFPQHLAP